MYHTLAIDSTQLDSYLPPRGATRYRHRADVEPNNTERSADGGEPEGDVRRAPSRGRSRKRDWSD